MRIERNTVWRGLSQPKTAVVVHDVWRGRRQAFVLFEFVNDESSAFRRHIMDAKLFLKRYARRALLR